MNLIVPELLKNKSITSVIRTLKAEESGRCLIETTTKLENQAKNLVENTLLDLEERLEALQAHMNFHNQSLTAWVANDIHTFVNATTVEHPDTNTKEPIPNA